MSIVTIRICEESDAKLMLKDGTFKDYLQLWCDQFPQQGLGKLHQIKEIKDHYGCGLREAKQIADSAGLVDTVRFEIGDNLRLEKRSGGFQLYRKSASAWEPQGNVTDCLYEWILFPKKGSVSGFKDYGEF